MSTSTKTFGYYTSEFRHHPWLLAGALMMEPGYVFQNIISALFIAKSSGNWPTIAQSTQTMSGMPQTRWSVNEA
jgi:hypothetical protein